VKARAAEFVESGVGGVIDIYFDWLQGEERSDLVQCHALLGEYLAE
jgi:hypothetical protein